MRNARCYIRVIEHSRHGSRQLFMKNMVQSFDVLKWQSTN